HVMDHSAGMHAALAVMAALHQRRRTGNAQHVDLAAREVSSAMIGDALLQASVGETPKRPGNGDLAMAPHGVYETAHVDRWISIPVRNDAEWRALTSVLGHEEAASDPRFATREARLSHTAELDALMSHWLSDCDGDVLAERLQRAGVSAHVSWTMRDVA